MHESKEVEVKHVGVLLAILVFCGCAVMSEHTGKDIIHISRISLGMTKQEVSLILGDRVTVGHQIIGDSKDRFNPITIENPRRSEKIKVNNKAYEVLYYFTHIKEHDDAIAEDELTPLTFYNDILVAKDWAYVRKLKARVVH